MLAIRKSYVNPQCLSLPLKKIVPYVVVEKPASGPVWGTEFIRNIWPLTPPYILLTITDGVHPESIRQPTARPPRQLGKKQSKHDAPTVLVCLKTSSSALGAGSGLAVC